MFFIFTKGPFGSLWGIRTEVARVYIPTMNEAKKMERLIDGEIELMLFLLLPAVDAKRARRRASERERVINSLTYA